MLDFIAGKEMLDLIVNALSLISFIGFVTFVITYFIRSDWRATEPGKALMYAMGALSLVLFMNTVHLFTGRYAGIQFVRIPVYGTLAVAAWRLVGTLLRILRTGDTLTSDKFYPLKKKKEK